MIICTQRQSFLASSVRAPEQQPCLLKHAVLAVMLANHRSTEDEPMKAFVYEWHGRCPASEAT